jgi:hypothetical protein
MEHQMEQELAMGMKDEAEQESDTGQEESDGPV